MRRNRTDYLTAPLLRLGILLLAALWLLPGCELSSRKDQQYGPVGPGTPTDTTDNPGDTTGGPAISIAPATVTVETGKSVQFTAIVTGTTNTGVTWVVESGPGTVNTSGLYTAPATISGNAVPASVKVVLNARPSVAAVASIAIYAPNSGGPPGDTAKDGDICFERDVLPIFRSNCAMSGCHDAVTREEGFVLDNYVGIIRGIDPGRPDHSEIFEKITEDRSDKIMPPPPNSPLTSEQIQIIELWILQGGRNTICPPPGNDCDTTGVTFSGFVGPLLLNNCGGCHGGSNPQGGINLRTYQGVQPVALDGRLYGAVSHASGYRPMPEGGPRLPDCDIMRIRAWINQGAPNN